MKKAKNISALLFVIVLFLFTQAYCYDVATHEKITENAFRKALQTRNFLTDIGYKYDDFVALKDYDQFSDGPAANNYTLSKSILDWFKYGSNVEDATFTRFDETIARYKNHFYDPINDRGLVFQNGLISISGMRAPDWALESGSISGQNYSLEDAKVYYKNALTAGTKIERDNNLAMTFKSLGHVLHTVEDMAQPQHTRNDSHGGDILGTSYGPQTFREKSQYESYVNGKVRSLTYSGYDPPTFDSYRKYYVTGDGKGLAEFSNRNFVTEGTNFDCTQTGLLYCNNATGGGYPNPVLNLGIKTEVQIGALIPGTTQQGLVTFFGNDIVDYNQPGQNIRNDYMTTYSIFDKDLINKGNPPAFTLNRFNYDSMAEILIPRAVGYSAGLLNYFFQGEIEIAPDLDNPGSYIINNFTNEPISGTFTLYYDDKEGKRQKVPLSQETLTVGGFSGDQPGKSIPVTFIAPTDPEPEEKGKYILIFQGTLGSEQGSVVGKVVNLENIWEDWEKGLTGRHPWSVGGYSSASTVVPGFEDNKTQVLKME